MGDSNIVNIFKGGLPRPSADRVEPSRDITVIAEDADLRRIEVSLEDGVHHLDIILDEGRIRIGSLVNEAAVGVLLAFHVPTYGMAIPFDDGEAT